jgi:hypothetical protein
MRDFLARSRLPTVVLATIVLMLLAAVVAAIATSVLFAAIYPLFIGRAYKFDDASVFVILLISLFSPVLVIDAVRHIRAGKAGAQSKQDVVRETCVACEKAIPIDAKFCPHCSTAQDPVAANATVLAVSQQRDTAVVRQLLRVGFVALLAYAGLYWLNRIVVAEVAENFILEQIGRQNITGYRVKGVEVPITSVLSSKYEVDIVLHRTETTSSKDEIKLVTGTITGWCLISSCLISMRRWQLLGL